MKKMAIGLKLTDEEYALIKAYLSERGVKHGPYVKKLLLRLASRWAENQEVKDANE